MSKKSRAMRKARQELSDPRTVLKARGPGDIVTMIPYQLGFYPSESVVIVALEGPRQRIGVVMRGDLVEPVHAPRVVDYLVATVTHHRVRQVVLAAFSERAGVATAVMEPLRAALEAAGVRVVESVRTDRRRWWSYLCSDPGCCPVDGTPYDAGSTPIAAEAVLAGLSMADSREALRDLFAPAPDDVRAAVERVAEARLDAILRSRDELRRAAWLRATIAGSLGDAAVPADVLGELVAHAQFIHLRDAAWLMMSRRTAGDHFDLWRQAVRVVPDRLAAAVGSLAGFAAWLEGHGALASHACEWVAERSPTYSMNLLLQRILDQGLNPDAWDLGPPVEPPVS